MKKLFGIIVLAMLPLVFASCGDDDEENVAPQEQENKDDNTNKPDDSNDQDTPEVKDVIVEVDRNGNAAGGHRFTRIDATNFSIDDIIYTLSGENLIVSGFDPIFFKGEANIIFALRYGGVTMVVKSIYEKAFRNCTALTSVNIPNSVTSLGQYAFTGCTGLTSINIPNSVTSLGQYAFTSCTGLTSITIPNSVTTIGSSAFAACSGLTSITIPNSVTTIGSSAFENCSGLTSVSIPNSVTSIGSNAFSYCSGLTDIYCYATTPPSTYYNNNYKYNTFYSTNLSSITLHVPAESVDTYKSKSPWSGFGSIVAIE